MKKKKKEDHYQKTQSASSPGTLGEEVNRQKNKIDTETVALSSSEEEGINEEKSSGINGAFEGFENTDR